MHCNDPVDVRAEALRHTRPSYPWAVIRLAFGLLQMLGSACALYLLAVRGLTPITIVLLVATTLATMTSRALFRQGRAR